MKIKIALLFLFILVAPLGLARVKITYGVSTDQNKRPYQEDRFTYARINKGEFFGIYDGHGGDRASSLLKDNLHLYFAKAKGSLKAKFQHAFEQADYISQNSWSDGSTALAIYIDEKDVMYCAWAGDTRAVLEGNGKVFFATQDDKPDRLDEKQRIERAGGEIVKYGVWRVNGLAVSRSIGDVECKRQGIGQIIATPEYARIQLKSKNHFLIFASDGLWDVVENEDAVATVNSLLHSEKSLDVIAKALQGIAIKKGSDDNITVCVVQFDWLPVSTSRKWWNWLWGK
jgi:protein phosphatase 1L